jgi:hypothetical protein
MSQHETSSQISTSPQHNKAATVLIVVVHRGHPDSNLEAYASQLLQLAGCWQLLIAS